MNQVKDDGTGNDRPKLWLIGGTGDSRILTEALLSQGFTLVVSVTTTIAARLYPRHRCLTVQVGRLTEGEIPKLLQAENIRAIVDASHPFAIQISQSAVRCAQQQGLPYLRFERPSLTLGNQGVEVADLATLLKSPLLFHKRVLLTVGANWLPQFAPLQSQATLFARILPRLDSLQTAIAAGFTPDRIIALRPPISADLERALWQQWQIEIVVTKASGTAGGEDRKQALAQALGIQLIRIARPDGVGGEVTHEVDRVYQFCQTYLP
ncbi:MAG: cobalt-precorrin-6A reductase [Synechocystis sp.]|nr:cobalt-precorrin-6A reductase [Synechocystis sp.]